jgi:hypothetical protein
MFELNDLVVILSGGISGLPTVSLAGVQGRVVSPHPSTPDGWIAVWVDWSKTPYKNMAGLPNPINNTPEMIELVEPETAKPSTPTARKPATPAAPQPAEEREAPPPSPFRLI